MVIYFAGEHFILTMRFYLSAMLLSQELWSAASTVSRTDAELFKVRLA